MANVRVSPIWDGDPNAPDSTAEVTTIRLFFEEEQHSNERLTPIDLTLGLEVAVDLDAARQLWGRLGDVLREAAGEG